MRFLCLVSSLRSLLCRSAAFLRPGPARRGTHNCAARGRTVRGCKPVAPDCGTSKASSLPGPGSAALLGLRPRRGSYQRLSHVTRRPAAAKPEAIQALGRCSLQGGIRFCLPASVLFGAGSGAGFGRREPQPAPRLGSREWKGVERSAAPTHLLPRQRRRSNL